MLVACGGSGGGQVSGLDTQAPQQIAASAPRCAQPEAGEFFAREDAELLGFDPERLQEAIDFGMQLQSVSIRIYRYGCLAGESALDPLTVYVPHPLASASKTLLSLAFGRAVTLGLISVNDTVGQYIPEADAAHSALTAYDLLTQTSGLQVVLADEFAAVLSDPVRFTLSLPSWYAPGEEFMYAQATLAVLARMLEVATGMDFQDFVQLHLMEPLGIARDHWVWLRDRSGGTVVMGGLLMRPADEARIGHLMLYRGRWQGTQLIDADYMREAVTGTSANPGHGYLFWLNSGDRHNASRIGRPLPVDHPLLPGSPRDAHGAMGLAGQMIIAVPSRDLVIVRNGGPGGGASTVEGKDYKEFIRLVAASINDKPQITGLGPYDYPDSPSQFEPSEFEANLADWRLLGMMLGVGTGSMPGCTIYLCNGRVLVEDLAVFGLDTLQQLLAAVAATSADVALAQTDNNDEQE